MGVAACRFGSWFEVAGRALRLYLRHGQGWASIMRCMGAAMRTPMRGCARAGAGENPPPRGGRLALYIYLQYARFSSSMQKLYCALRRIDYDGVRILSLEDQLWNSR